MKFPKSVHAEGWLNHVEATAPEHLPEALGGDAAPRVDRKPMIHGERAGVAATASSLPPRATAPVPAAAAFSAPRSPAAATESSRSSAATPWLLGAGAGIALIVVAVTMSRHTSSVEPSALPPTVVGEAKPSPEDAQLQATPPAAGIVTPAPETQPAQAEAPPVTATPAAEPPVAVAAAPVTPKVQAPAPVRPESRTLSPRPETLAQAAPPPVVLREPPPQAVAPTVTPTPAAPPTPPAAVPETATPVVPPVAQQPLATDPEDPNITVKVRMALSTDAVLSAVPIVVSTDHGVVKLEGQAPDAQARERATVVAAATTGVKAVDNRLTLPPVASLGGAQNGG